MNNHDLAWIASTSKEQRLSDLLDTMTRVARAYAEDADRVEHLAEGYDIDREDENLDERERRSCALQAGKYYKQAAMLRRRSAELLDFAELLATCK
jgi:arginine/lysine/ornithine decarboxylase